MNAIKQKEKKSSNGVTGCHTVVSDCMVYLVNFSALICVYPGGWTEFTSAPPISKSLQIPSSQLGTLQVKIRQQIGLLANLSGEWLAR